MANLGLPDSGHNVASKGHVANPGLNTVLCPPMTYLMSYNYVLCVILGCLAAEFESNRLNVPVRMKFLSEDVFAPNWNNTLFIQMYFFRFAYYCVK